MSDVTTIDAAGNVALKATAAATYGGSGAAVLFGLTANEVAAYGGLIVAVIAGIANVLINWYWRRRHYRLAEQEVVERRRQDLPVVHDRRRQGGAVSRTLVSVMGLSAAAFIGLVVSEGYVGEAMIPTKNDRPTVGFGSTFHEDGRPVKLGDTTTPVRALIKAQAHISKEERAFRDSLPGVKLYQAEYDLYMDWVYQYGTVKWSASSMRRHLRAEDYRAACDALLLYKYSGGFDCSDPKNWGKGGDCKGVWTRQLERHAKCIAAQ